MGARARAATWTEPRLGRPSSPRAKPLVAAAAIRIPDRVSAQLALAFPCAAPQLFVHEGARQSLERRLGLAHLGPVAVSITDNRHSIVSHSLVDGVLRARIHHMFLGAPARVQDALIRYVTRGDRQASAYVGSFIEANGAKLARRSRALPLSTRGDVHDLLSIAGELNERYFDGQVHALVTWGKDGRRRRLADGRRRPRTTIKLGSYSTLDRLIRVHPVLDRAWVPRYFVKFVVYHEMLHHVLPARRAVAAGYEHKSLQIDEPRALHPPEFRARERLFREYERALAWEKRHLSRLLRA